MLFVAAESLLESRQPSKREFDEVLRDAGLNPDGLPLHTGLLIALRGQIVHEGLEDHERLRTAFYEMEAIVRILIRRVAGLKGGWWPAHGPGGYASDFDELAYEIRGHRTQWHRRRLPSVSSPERAQVPRKVLGPSTELLVTLDASVYANAPTGTAELIASVVADGHAWVDPDGPKISVFVGRPEQAAGRGDLIHNRDELWIAPARIVGVLDESQPQILVNFVWDLHGAVGSMAMMRRGVASEGGDVALVEGAGALHQYSRLIVHGEFEAGLLQIPAIDGPYEAGKVAGWAAAGDARARAALASAESPEGQLGRQVQSQLSRDARVSRLETSF